MKTDGSAGFSKRRLSRREFLGKAGVSTAGLLIAPYLKAANVFAYADDAGGSSLVQVALTQADSYARSLVKQKVQHLFESIGGIGDLVSTGKKVATKINLTGGGGDADHMWTHPEVLRFVGELLQDDSGVRFQTCSTQYSITHRRRADGPGPDGSGLGEGEPDPVQ